MSVPANEKAFLNWISTFSNLSSHPDTFSSLADGILLTEVMHEIEPNIFDLSKINRDAADNWALRLSNNSSLYEGLEKYYTNILHKPFDKAYVDVARVSNNDNQIDLYNLVQLVLGAAVQCPNKEKYINAILLLDDSCQNALMDMIDTILHEEDTTQQPSNLPEPDLHNPNRPTVTTVIRTLEAQEKDLLTKVDELEKESQQLKDRVTELEQESKDHKIRESEFVFEIEKKSEEVKKLLQERENMQIIADAQESIEELKNDLKLKDHKLDQLDEYIEELKHNHQGQIAKYEDEIDKQKKKINDLIKVEGSMRFYEQKYQEYTQMTVKLTETEEEVQKYKSKVEEVNKLNEALQNKFNTYREKLETEKTNNISLDIELTKKKTEIETLKSEKKRLDATNAELEKKLHDQNRAVEKYKKENEDTRRNYANTDKAMAELAGQNYSSLAEEERRSAASTEPQTIVDDGEKEILQQENKILIAKCKQIQIENESLKTIKEGEDKAKEKLESENNKLKEEIAKLREGLESNASPKNIKLAEAEIESLRRQLNEAKDLNKKKVDNEDIVLLRDELSEKNKLIGQLSEEIVGIRGGSDKNKKLEEEVAKKNDEIKELNEQLQTINGILTEAEDQKEEELKVLAAAIQELALRNLDLEKQVNSRGDISGSISIPKTSHATAVTQGYKGRK